MATEIESLVAEREIRAQLHRCCRAVDALDVRLLRAAWHPDGTLDYEKPEMRGLASDLAADLIAWYGGWEARCHQVTNPLIEVRGDRAVSESYVLDVLRRPAADAAGALDLHRRGRCVDRWSRRDGRWALDHRQCLASFSWRRVLAEEDVR